MTNTKFKAILAILLITKSTASFASSSLTVTAWNLEWLTSHPSDKFSESQRSKQDFQALAGHFSTIDSDVLAFQEVNDQQALHKVIGDDYRVYFSDRASDAYMKQQFDEINQYTGFAVKEDIEVADKPDIQLDQRKNSKLRFGTYIVLNPNGSQPIHALSVHLKARCSGAYKNSRDCKILKSQGKALNQWISEREQQGENYAILGDFNHNLSYNGDWLWEVISHSSQAVLATKGTPATCKVRSRKNPNKTHQFRSLIDHIIVSPGLTTAQTNQDVFPPSLVLQQHLSDHCPISTQLN